jgi:EAL domain-containing protein (putative c-di-GMP-specific phosphodiesterase class I)
LQPLNAMAVRPPANTPAAAAPAASEPVTAESLGWQLRAALPPLRLHSVSLYDDQANVLWLSEGALGPDEHNVVLEAMETLANDTSLPCYENGLEDGRVGIFLPVRAPQGDLVGIAMILADLKSVGDGVLERMVGPQVRTIMQKIAVLLRPGATRVGSAEPVVPVLELAPERASTQPRPVAAAVQPPAALAGTAPSAPAQTVPIRPASAAAKLVAAPPSSDALSPQAIDDILEFELFPEPRSVENLKPAPPATMLPPTPPVLAESVMALELLGDLSPPTVEPETAKPSAKGSSPARVTSPVKATTQVVPTVTPTPETQPLAAAPAAPASVANEASLSFVAADAVPTAIASPNTPTGPAAVASAASETSAPVITASPAAAPTAATSISASAPKSSGATTTSKALATPATTGTARALPIPGATGTVPALGNPGATGTSRTLALDPTNLILEVQPFAKLRAGGRTRRYEVLARVPHRDANRASAAMDGVALQRLLAWLGTNRPAWSLEPTSFSLNLSISTLEDDRFPQHVASCLRANGIAADNIGFEIAESLCTQRRAQVERFITLCDKLGCFVVIDDFSFDSSMLPLLRSKALRLVKIDPKLTSAALRDKLSQAMVVAIVQAVKVLGIHCAAKRVDSQASLQWLTAIGCDFAQGPALSQVQPLEALAQPQNLATEAGKAG